MARSLRNLNMQVDTVSASMEQIQSFPDVPDFAYKPMGPHSGLKLMPISQVAGISFYMIEFTLHYITFILAKGSELI